MIQKQLKPIQKELLRFFKEFEPILKKNKIDREVFESQQQGSGDADLADDGNEGGNE